jgi:DNA processing protein
MQCLGRRSWRSTGSGSACCPGWGRQLQKKLLQRFGSPVDVYHAGAGELLAVDGLGKTLVQRMLAARSLEGAARMQEKLQKSGTRLLVLSDPLYPEMVKSLAQAPAVLYYRGTLREAELWCGDRGGTALYGLW